MDLRGKHVFITGSARRLGRTLCRTFAENGCRVTGTFHRSKAEMADLKRELAAGDATFNDLRIDLSRPRTFDRAIATATQTLGPIDILVQNASVFLRRSALDTTSQEWDDVFSVNVRAPFLLTAAWKRSIGNQTGILIQIGDAFASRAMPNYAAYAISKSALTAMGRQFAVSLAPSIRVATIHPGPVLPEEDRSETSRQRIADKTLFKRWGTSEDVVNAALWFCRADYASGIEFSVDGGLSIA